MFSLEARSSRAIQGHFMDRPKLFLHLSSVTPQLISLISSFFAGAPMKKVSPFQNTSDQHGKFAPLCMESLQSLPKEEECVLGHQRNLHVGASETLVWTATGLELFRRTSWATRVALHDPRRWVCGAAQVRSGRRTKRGHVLYQWLSADIVRVRLQLFVRC